MEYKPTNCAVIPCKGEFYKRWFEFQEPLHHMTNREMDIAAEFLTLRAVISKSVTDEKLVDKLLFSPENKAKIRDKFGMTKTYFYTVITSFKNHRFILEDNGDLRVNPKFIPKFGNDKKICQLLIVFNNNEKA